MTVSDLCSNLQAPVLLQKHLSLANGCSTQTETYSVLACYVVLHIKNAEEYICRILYRLNNIYLLLLNALLVYLHIFVNRNVLLLELKLILE